MIAVAFAGVVPSTYARNSGYFSRVGVLQRHWGKGLQLRLMRADRSAGPTHRMEQYRFGYNGQSFLRE